VIKRRTGGVRLCSSLWMPIVDSTALPTPIQTCSVVPVSCKMHHRLPCNCNLLNQRGLVLRILGQCLRCQRHLHHHLLLRVILCFQFVPLCFHLCVEEIHALLKLHPAGVVSTSNTNWVYGEGFCGALLFGAVVITPRVSPT
jgi:hypothetical protein